MEKSSDLKEYSNHIFKWHTTQAEIGEVGNCNAISINAHVNVQMEKGDRPCVYSAMVSYTDFPSENLEIADAELIGCN